MAPARTSERKRRGPGLSEALHVMKGQNDLHSQDPGKPYGGDFSETVLEHMVAHRVCATPFRRNRRSYQAAQVTPPTQQNRIRTVELPEGCERLVGLAAGHAGECGDIDEDPPTRLAQSAGEPVDVIVKPTVFAKRIDDRNGDM